jgi:threonine dehydratase
MILEDPLVPGSRISVPTHKDILDAAKRIKGKILRSPFLLSDPLSRQVNRSIYLKLESLQPGGSFKFRGANNAVSLLTEEEKEKGVVAASSGNHGLALALAASRAGIKATIVLPENAPQVKVDRIKKTGVTIIRYGPHYGYSEEKAAELGKKELVLIHPFDDPRVVAGQGTIGLEIDEDASPDLEAVLVPVGGGGLIAGIALGLKYTRLQVKVIGVESYAAPSLTQALKAGKPVPIDPQPTCADSLSPRFTGGISFEVAKDRIRQVILLTEEELMEGVRYCLEELHMVVEPAGAAGISALLAGKAKLKDGPACVVVSGSNLDKEYFKEALSL